MSAVVIATDVRAPMNAENCNKWIKNITDFFTTKAKWFYNYFSISKGLSILQ